jgi:hypothetical protein
MRLRGFYLFILVLLLSCGRQEKVELRKFPFPYRAALSISSDCDYTETVDEFLEIMRYLNTYDTTSIGPGLGLEVGYSFWFYDPQKLHRFTVFSDTTTELSPWAPLLEEGIRSGYLDILHTYGEFSFGGFRREFARWAVDFMERESLRLYVWINHGSSKDSQNVGPLSCQMGDNPNSEAYHTDMFPKLGILFVGKYDVVHTVGQDAPLNLKDRMRQLGEAFLYLKRRREWMLFNFLRNHLLEPITLDDGRMVFSIKRFISKSGSVERPDAQSLSIQICPDVLDELISKGGFMVVYTHLGLNLGPPRYFGEGTRRALEELAQRFHRGEILVTTTKRLLFYNLLYRYLDWDYRFKGDTLTIVIEGVDDPVQGRWIPKEEELQGITFYVEDPKKTKVFLRENRLTNLLMNPPDESGRPSVSIPWKPLKFPESWR